MTSDEPRPESDESAAQLDGPDEPTEFGDDDGDDDVYTAEDESTE